MHVMADATFGSLAVDEIAAGQVGAQCVVHYGHATLSAPESLPVFYVFPKRDDVDRPRLLSTAREAAKSAAACGRRLVVFPDLALMHLAPWLAQELEVRAGLSCI